MEIEVPCGNPQTVHFTGFFELPHIKQEAPEDNIAQHSEHDGDGGIDVYKCAKWEGTTDRKDILSGHFKTMCDPTPDVNICAVKTESEATDDQGLVAAGPFLRGSAYVKLENNQHKIEVSNSPVEFLRPETSTWPTAVEQESEQLVLTSVEMEEEEECKIDIGDHMFLKCEPGISLPREGITGKCSLCGADKRQRKKKHKRSSLTRRKGQHKRRNTMYKCTECGHRAEKTDNSILHVGVNHNEDLPELPGTEEKAQHDVGLPENVDRKEIKKRRRRRTWLTYKKGSKRHQNVYKCMKCNYSNFSKMQLTQHVYQIHDFAKLHKCLECDFTSIGRTPVQEHIRATGHVVLHRCAECEYTSEKRNEFNKHIVAGHGTFAKVYACTECAYTTNTEGKMNRHKIKHDPTADVYKCAHCDYTTKYQSNLLWHFKSKHAPPAKVLRCTSCNHTTKSTISLVQHVMQKHRMQKCRWCAFETKWKATLVKHTAIKHKLQRCTKCKFSTRLEKKLADHMRINH